MQLPTPEGRTAISRRARERLLGRTEVGSPSPERRMSRWAELPVMRSHGVTEDEDESGAMTMMDAELKIAERALQRFFHHAPPPGGYLPEPASEEEFALTLREMARQGAAALLDPSPRELAALRGSGHSSNLFSLPMAAAVAMAHASSCPPPVSLFVLNLGLVPAGAWWNRELINLATDLPGRLLAQRDECRRAGARYTCVVVCLMDTYDFGDAHVNVLLVDSAASAVYHFEPQGERQVMSPELQESLQQKSPVVPEEHGFSLRLAHILRGSPLRFFPAADVICPSWTDASLLNYSALQTGEHLCQIWAVAFMDACLAVPDLVRPDRPGGFADIVYRAFATEPDIPNPLVSLLAFYIVRLDDTLLWFAREMLVVLANEIDPSLEPQAVRARIRERHLRAMLRTPTALPVIKEMLRGTPENIRRDPDMLDLLQTLGLIAEEAGLAASQQPAKRARVTAAAAAMPAPAPAPAPPAARRLRPDPAFVPMLYTVLHDAHLAANPLWTGDLPFPELDAREEVQQRVLADFPVQDILLAARLQKAIDRYGYGRLLTDIYHHGLAKILRRLLGQQRYDAFLAGAAPGLVRLVRREEEYEDYRKHEQQIFARVQETEGSLALLNRGGDPQGPTPEAPPSRVPLADRPTQDIYHLAYTLQEPSPLAARHMALLHRRALELRHSGPASALAQSPSGSIGDPRSSSGAEALRASDFHQSLDNLRTAATFVARHALRIEDRRDAQSLQARATALLEAGAKPGPAAELLVEDALRFAKDGQRLLLEDFLSSRPAAAQEEAET